MTCKRLNSFGVRFWGLVSWRERSSAETATAVRPEALLATVATEVVTLTLRPAAELSESVTVTAIFLSHS